jgi:hypothetical protein
MYRALARRLGPSARAAEVTYAFWRLGAELLSGTNLRLSH